MNAVIGQPPSSRFTLDHTELIDVGNRLVDACPDMREMARIIAQRILTRHTGANIEPDHVYWHRFHTEVSSSRSFTGWQHLDAPYESMTLPQLVMHRFNPQDQDSADTLQMLGGFYKAGPDAQIFDERNEVRMLPIDVMNDFWAIDFKTLFREKQKAFWHDCANDFRTLAKASFLVRALEDHEAGWLTKKDLRLVMAAAGIDTSTPLSLGMLQAHFVAIDKVHVCTFDVVGYEASDILRIVAEDGRQILYTPGEIQSFHVFEKPTDLHWWLLLQNRNAGLRARFMGHFPLSTHQQGDKNIELHHALDLLYSTWGSTQLDVINQKSQSLSIDPFSHLSNSTQSRMAADADIALRSNGELRKQLWIGYLKDFMELSGAFAAIDWPIALAAVGAGIADVGMNIEQAIYGHSTAERKAGVTGAVLAGIDTLFNGLFLLGAPVEAEISAAELKPDVDIGALEPEQGAHKIPTIADVSAIELSPIPAGKTENPLAPFETNVLLDTSAPPREDGKMKGIYLTRFGKTYISIDDFAYSVRYVNEIKSWVIIDPKNPFSFYRNLPVRLCNDGIWVPVPSKGLRGGVKFFGKFSWGKSATTAGEANSPVARYEIPDALKPALFESAQYRGDKGLQGYRSLQSPNTSAYDTFDRIRSTLCGDASDFYKNPELPPRPEIPALVTGAPIKRHLKDLFRNSSGLVIGESHSSIGSKQFLIDNMPLLAKQKVRTLYMEHLLTDFHQADLDDYAKTGTMSKRLEEYLNLMDDGHHTDSSGTYTFLALIKAANENHVRLQAIDCMASYRLVGRANTSGTLRQQVMNYFAKLVIDADQATQGGGKWIALVGNSHANTYAGVPGLSELEGAIGLRVEDVHTGSPNRIEPDPGLDLSGRSAGIVKSDLRLQAVVEPQQLASISVESRMARPGTYSIEKQGAQSTLIHRSKEGALVRTPIKSDHGRIYIERPKWQNVSGRRFDDIQELTSALKLMGMTRIT